MDMQPARVTATGTDPDTGYDTFRLGGFTFRRDIRTLQAVTCLGPLAIDFPHASQALRIRRRRYNPVTGGGPPSPSTPSPASAQPRPGLPTWPTGYEDTG